MQIEFIHNEHSDRLILIFAGWGSDAAAFEDAGMPGWDVAVVSGIDEDIPSLDILRRYHTVYVYAWSLGVWSAERVLAGKIMVTKAYAINGTPWPCDDLRGIPTDIFSGTAHSLSLRNLYKFRVRMCGGVEGYKSVSSKFEHLQDIDALQKELLMVAAAKNNSTHLHWNEAFVSINDRIFPADNQQRAWQGISAIQTIDKSHYVDLQEIISQTIVDVVRVGKRFTRSLDTYDAHSHAQRMIAEELAVKLRDVMTRNNGMAVEIGCGTGNFTREWSKCFSAKEVVYIDLCDMPKFGISVAETYIKGDAEKEISRIAEECKSKFTAIFSASTIQWFSNLPLFFANCAKALSPEGFLAISTFAPGNLEELQRLRPDHLQYADEATIREMVSAHFEDVRVSEGKIELEFSTPLEALRHLQLTGVTTSGSRKATVGKLRRFSETYPMNERGRYTLTFRPIYILARLPRK